MKQLALVPVVALAASALLPSQVFADGTESLGPPSISIPTGSGIAAAGVGLGTSRLSWGQRTPSNSTVIFDVPGTAVNQALLYWSGEGFDVGDDTLLVDNGVDPQKVTGTLIGGPTSFFDTPEFGKVFLTTFRADITDLVQPGPNSLSFEGLDFGFSTSGAGVLVIYDDGTVTDIDIRDGQDLAFVRFRDPLDATIPQTFSCLPSEVDRGATLSMFFGSVGTGEIRPSLIRITVEGGEIIEYPNLLASVDGPLWDTVISAVPVPAGTTSLTVEVFSVEDGTGNTPASLNWIAAALDIDPPGPCEGVDCDDQDVCTLDACDPEDGTCGYTDVDCDDDNACTVDSCDPVEGCLHDDVSDTCIDDVACTVDTCDPVSGCTNAPDDSVCNDDNACTTDRCDPIEGCVHDDGSVTCDDGIACTVDSCDQTSGDCINTPQDELCDDNELCTDDICDAELGCVSTPNDDNFCDDGLFCNGPESCLGGTCQPGDDPCDDGVACTTDLCDEQSETCTHTADDSACSNGLYCDGEEVCDPELGCLDGPDPDCDDGIVCTVDACDEQNDTCSHTTDDAVCSNGAFCDGEEVCVVGVGCVDGPDPNCDDEQACTADECDEENDTCAHTPSDVLCNDDDACTTDWCDPTGGCAHEDISDTCDDGVVCTTDICDSASGCTNTPVDAACNDDDACTADRCDPVSGCVHDSTTQDCDDGIACTIDSCDPTSGCLSTPDDSACNDNDACTTDVCTSGGCQHSDNGQCEACCLPDSCIEITASACRSMGGTPQGGGTSCSSVSCPVCGNGVVDPGEVCDGSDDDSCPGECLSDCSCPVEVPAVSTWGLIAFGLIILVLAKLTFSVRQRNRRKPT